MWSNSIYIKAESAVEFIDDIYVLLNDTIDLKNHYSLSPVFFFPFVNLNSAM